MLRLIATFFAILLKPGVPMQATEQLPGKEEMMVKITKYEVKPSYQSRLQRSISDYVFSALLAKGNIMAEAYFESVDTTTWWLIERWSSHRAYDSSLQTKQARSLALLVKEALRSSVVIFDVRDLEPLPKSAYHKTPKKNDKPFTLMLFVDAKQGTQEQFKKLYHAAMPEFRKELGVVTYQLSQVKNDETRFITYEKFRNEEAFQYHLKIPAIAPVIRYLRTSIKQPPFENGLHKLIEFAPLFRE